MIHRINWWALPVVGIALFRLYSQWAPQDASTSTTAATDETSATLPLNQSFDRCVARLRESGVDFIGADLAAACGRPNVDMDALVDSVRRQRIGEADARIRTLETRRTLPRLTLDEAIKTYWDEIQPYVNGVDDIEACDLTNVGCYTLPADIISGHIDTIHFPNGGSISFYTPIDESGTALEVDFDGRLWEFTVDMNSPLVESAVDEWAQANGYRVGR